MKRDCEHCVFHSAEGCSKWECKFVPTGIITCKECRFWKAPSLEISYCDRLDDWIGTDEDDYCSFAERKA